MFCEVGGRGHVAFLRVTTSGEPIGGADHPLPGPALVDLGETFLDLRVADQEPAPAREIATRRRLLGDVDAVEDDLLVNVAF